MATDEAVVVCLLISVMDVVAGVLGLHAENAQHQVRLRILFIECRQSVRQAYELGVARHRERRRRVLVRVLRRPAADAEPADGVLRARHLMNRDGGGIGAADPGGAAERQEEGGGVRAAAPPLPLHRRHPLLRPRALLPRLLRLRQRRQAGRGPPASVTKNNPIHAFSSLVRCTHGVAWLNSLICCRGRV